MNNNISVEGNSTINLLGSDFTQVEMGTVSLDAVGGGTATLNINADPGQSLHLSGLNLGGVIVGGTDTINATVTVFAGQFNAEAISTLVKTGTNTLIFDNTATQNIGGSATIDVQQGAVEIIDGNSTSTGTYNPIGGASLKIDGGTLEYDSKLAADGAFEPAKVTVTSAGGTLQSAEAMTVVLAGSLQLNGNLKIATASGDTTNIASFIRLAGGVTGSGNIEKVASQLTGDTSNQGTLEFAVSSPNWTGSLNLDANAGSIQGDFDHVTDEPFGASAVTVHGGAINLVRYGGGSGATYAPGNDVNADGDFAINTRAAFGQPDTYFQLGHLTLSGSRIVTQNGDSTTGVLFTGAIFGGDTTFNVGTSLVLGPVTESAPSSLTKTGTGTLVLTGSNSAPGLTTVQAGLLDVEGSVHTSGVNVMGGAVLGGKGTVLDGLVAIHSNAALAPSLGSTTPIGGPFNVQGNLAFDDSTAKLVLDLAGVTPGSGYDQVQYGANVSLDGATLVLNDSAETQALPAVQRFWILDGLPGSSAVNGLLSYQGQLLADGSTFTDSAGQQFMIDYNAPGDPNGTSNDILLTTTPEPGATALLLTSAIGLLLRRRRRGE